MPKPRGGSNRPAVERLREAFWQLLEEKSYDRITVSEIIARAGVNRSAFYYHYANFDELADDAIAEATHSDEVVAMLVRFVQDGFEDPRDRFEQAISSPTHMDTILKIALLVGPHGSPVSVRRLKDFIVELWLDALGVEFDGLSDSQRVTIEFVVDGVLGILGMAPELSERSGTAWVRDSPLPYVLVGLIASLHDEK